MDTNSEDVNDGPVVVVWGELLWDLFPADDGGAQLGGAPANVAWHLGQLGHMPHLVTRIGDDELGARALDRLRGVVGLTLVQVDRERATGVVEVTVDRTAPPFGGAAGQGQAPAVGAGEPRYRLVPGRAWQRIACTAEARSVLATAGALVYGTLAQLEPEGLAGWRDAIAAVPASCAKVCDVNLRRGAQDVPAIAEAIAAATIVKVNDRELATLADWYGWADPIARLRAGRKLVAVTHGASGSTIYDEFRSVRVAGVAARPGGDNVGCGDAYLAMLIYTQMLDWDLETQGAAASRLAAAVAGVRGATPTFTRQQIDELLDLPP